MPCLALLASSAVPSGPKPLSNGRLHAPCVEGVEGKHRPGDHNKNVTHVRCQYTLAGKYTLAGIGQCTRLLPSDYGATCSSLGRWCSSWCAWAVITEHYRSEFHVTKVVRPAGVGTQASTAVVACLTNGPVTSVPHTCLSIVAVCEFSVAVVRRVGAPWRSSVIPPLCTQQCDGGAGGHDVAAQYWQQGHMITV